MKRDGLCDGRGAVEKDRLIIIKTVFTMNALLHELLGEPLCLLRLKASEAAGISELLELLHLQLEEGTVMFRAHRAQTSLTPHRNVQREERLARAIDVGVEPLESRWLCSVTATSAGGVLTVMGDNKANAITVSRDVAGNLLVNNGAVKIIGSAATVGNTTAINVFGFNGDDNITLDETNGVLPAASLSGGNGNDTLTGGSGNDSLNGDNGNDVLLGKAGNDFLFGGNGKDTLTGGVGTDQAFGQGGNDLMIWNPGEGSDLNEGGDGIDTVQVIGGNVDEVFTATAVGDRVSFQRTSPGPFSIDIGTSEKLVLNMNGGNDSFTGGTGLAGKMAFYVDGGAGNDTLLGTDGNDTLLGGDGNDLIDGNGGADVARMGAGDDVFRWDPGDGSDLVEGEAGNDQMLFNGSNGNENVDLSANKGRLRFFRDAGNITMDVNGVENVQFNALGGVDNVTVHNLAGTDVKNVSLDLESAVGSGKGDGQVDSVVVEGSKMDDVITVTGSAASQTVSGLAATVGIRGADPTDKVTVNALGGADVVNASGLAANAVVFTADGGAGRDVLIGSTGNDTLLGGDGRDVLIGNGGVDHLDGGAGNNTIVP